MQRYMITIDKLYTDGFCSRYPLGRQTIETEEVSVPTFDDVLEFVNRATERIAFKKLAFPKDKISISYGEKSIRIEMRYEGYPAYFTYGVEAVLHQKDDSE